MAKDRKGSSSERNEKEQEEDEQVREKDEPPPKRDHGRKSKRRNESDSEDEENDGGDYSSERDSDRKHRRSKKKRRKRSSKRSSRRRHSDDDSSSSCSESDSGESESESESGGSSRESDSEEERRRRRKRRERKRKEREYEKERRRRRKEKEKKKRKKDKKEKKKKKESMKGAVTNSWGKYGIIRETDMWNKRPEFTAWLLEIKKVNLESLPNWEEKQMFKEFMEDHNTATFPSEKYYNLDAYHRRKIEKEVKKGSKKVQESERIIFNDEEQRRLEMMQVREKQKEQEVETLKRAMQSGLAQAMKEQAQLREEMAYQYKLGNFEAAAAIQKRLDPDVAP